MRINLLLALTLSSISVATATQAEDLQKPNQQATQLTVQRPVRRTPTLLPGRLPPISPEARGRQAMRNGNYLLAERIFREILQDGHAEEYKIHTYLGLSIYNQAIGSGIFVFRAGERARHRPAPHIGSAITAFENALRLEPTHNEALEGLSKSYEYRGDSFFNQRFSNLDQAIEDYQEAREAFMKIPRLRFVNTQQVGSRSQLPTQVRRINSKLARAYVKRGDQQERAGNQEAALQDYEQAFSNLELPLGFRDGQYCRGFRFAKQRTSSPGSSALTPNQFRANRRPLGLNTRPSRSSLSSLNLLSTNFSTEIRSKLARALTLRGDRRNAMNASVASEDYCRAIRINSEYAPAYFKLGQIFSDQGNHQQAISKYQEAIDANKKYLEAHVALAKAFEAQGEYDKVREIYIQIFKIAPNTPDIVSKLPREQLETLADHFRYQLRVDANSAHDHYYHLGRISFWQENFESAIEYFDQSIKSPGRQVLSWQGTRVPQNLRRPDAYRLRGLALSAQGKYQQAIESLEAAINLRPSNANSHYSLGAVLLKQGVDLQRAEASYREAIVLNDNYAEAYNALGEILLFKEGDSRSARSYFINAIKKDSQYAEPHNNLGQIYQQDKLFDQAIYAYSAALNISAHDYPDASNNLASAESQLSTWLDSQPNYRGPTGNTDWFWVDWDSDDEVSTLKRSVVRIVPRQGGTHGTGWVVEQENNSLWIVTNCHVIEDKGDIDIQFFSTLPAGREYLKLPATVIRSSCGPGKVDLALLKVDDAPDIPPLEIAPASLSSSSSLVRIVGHPSLSDEWTIVSGFANRNNSWNDDRRNQDRDHLQIDATVGTGNSGGPVINDQNQVVGIMHVSTGVARDSAATGGFAGAYSVSALRTTLGSWGLDLQ